MKDKTLLIMAAGMGSRFGGLKQIEPFGPHGEFIIDYSIYDAKRYGFNKVVFIIKEENYNVFKETIGKRVEPHIKTEYVFQNMENIPAPYYDLVKNREKPLGTGHAIYCAKDIIHEPFAVINADDFYGSDAYKKASKIIDSMIDTKPYPYAMIDYMVENTMTEFGSVKRGICEIQNGKLTNITESSVEKINNKIIATDLETGNQRVIEPTHPVSMNLDVFTPSIFNYINHHFLKFLEDNKNDLSKCEYFLPNILLGTIKDGYATVTMNKTNSTWYGVTYKEDTKKVKDALKHLHEINEYPDNLWD